ncbi:hypothetical protein SLITO_v1c09280 [Spiroplasma litorale]|uniref:Uncharacterized protein n=1 Tax=Spiroplasma litorale TaxID=216942 RepID=A0A0K1W2H9_9MOLU|nr:hypothetical protein [Spiroplasma litorale]AKX34539.1 hypothetical protein SLITO_v1c09280 [Spiroplasma litorale]
MEINSNVVYYGDKPILPSVSKEKPFDIEIISFFSLNEESVENVDDETYLN